jgi:hypothetical protein
MDNIYVITLISIFILIILIYLHINKLSDKFTSSDIGISSDILVSINKEKYKRYMNEKNKIKSLQEFGYSILPNTDERTLGFCPLGKYFKGDFTNKNEDVTTKCKKCFSCNKEPGYYFAGGCLGDKDSKCKFGRVDEEIFIKSHKSNSMLHDLLPREHTHLYKSNSYKNDKIIKQSNTVHTHL